VKLIYSAETVEIYADYKRIATHQRLRTKYHYTTLKEHLPAQHQYLMNWNPAFFENQAQKIGPHTLLVIQQMLVNRKYAEQAYKSCAGTLALAQKVGVERLEKACERALIYDNISLKVINNILERGLETAAEDPTTETKVIPIHANIRGANYYK
jgi:hypothetical protein